MTAGTAFYPGLRRAERAEIRPVSAEAIPVSAVAVLSFSVACLLSASASLGLPYCCKPSSPARRAEALALQSLCEHYARVWRQGLAIPLACAVPLHPCRQRLTSFCEFPPP